MKWNDVEISKAVEMIINGSNYEEISKVLNRSKNSVKNKLLSLGYKVLKSIEIIPNKHKKCLICESIKHFDKFSKNSSRKDGCQSTCKICKNKIDKEYYDLNAVRMRNQIYNSKLKRQEKVIRFVYDYLKINPCIDCSESDPIVLEFDHRDGVDKVDNISNMINSCSLQKIQDEIKKCDVRCANCHRRRTAKQMNWRILKITNINN